MLEKIKQRKAVQLLVFSKSQLIGISDINMMIEATAHQGVFGITIAKDYRGQGIGKKLMEWILKEAQTKLPQLRIITLGVFGNNPRAYQMYKKFGFQEFGRLPEGILHKGNYIDHIYMYKKVNN
ncbi:MAG: hypothetical protein A2857_00980 [Candidatus Levybacteria bacterium RIFCSPHIGHO2_01_FULL_36_15]|nr:MAG: hypothetical protein A2857_00980 [Candidatus Levybacteria bacterium RIFCSPHIGHO2_01_FULL_36_15]OGH38793.1 MAG: hypothetical protein A2905_02415 [Candidatus Levybacteria bacterium RIFCSPLOWO2_01_FULL_36_10]